MTTELETRLTKLTRETLPNESEVRIPYTHHHDYERSMETTMRSRSEVGMELSMLPEPQRTVKLFTMCWWMIMKTNPKSFSWALLDKNFRDAYIEITTMFAQFFNVIDNHTVDGNLK
jgi:hypothetical protein